MVVGAGFAGVAAAFAARRAGAEVCVAHLGPGASALYSGAVDGPLAPHPLLAELSGALGLRLASSSIVATREGVVRSAQGRDAALLDLAPLAGKRIGLVDVPRDDWDGPLLARAYDESDWARATGTRFELVPLALLERSHQRRVSAYDFAVSFERPERPGWLKELLKAHAGPDAWLFGPWLGLERALAAELTASVGVPVGEVTSPLGGAAGARFESRRDTLLASLGVESLMERVTEIRATDLGVLLRLAGGRELTGDSLVLASGGFVAGSLELSGALSGAEPAGFQLSILGLPGVEIQGDPARPVSSLFGVDLAARGRGLLERVGLPTGRGATISGMPRAFAAGEVVGPAPPSVGQALSSGLQAGTSAAALA